MKKRLFTTALALCILSSFVVASHAQAAIAIDSTGGNTVPDTAPSLTNSFSFTNTAGTMLVICANFFGSGTAITAATYNGVSLANVGVTADSAFLHGEEWFLASPATGSHTLSVTRNGSNTGNFFVSVATYTGMSLTGQPDAKVSTSNIAGTTIAQAITTVANNSWAVLCTENDGGGLTAGTGSTLRNSQPVAMGSSVMFDSNGPITPAGSYTMNATKTSNSGMSIIASFAPAAAVVVEVAALKVTFLNIQAIINNVLLIFQ